ncbi:hypothetical protein P175DRAFT_0471717 [Aspergillus ochraceoroseus IBT 24754]|uniref:Uncharacterized protein n=2 Tax=Aspergillus ochraceoroseus TaxID=138278 RepID=A0A2T5M8Y3_9EURO|nr:uncharacterized protein P175DRAFT_0471717 [Aspergillus ochraceoroseus IBT 24754]KKK15724.1 hypothetical protein AOCH_002038 [Aspergillus ochraceoroseus]PTU24991.1 hypothetical protein P175DRAFT_0471717 [Aspergillus ochraceoroseus IBT 24754]
MASDTPLFVALQAVCYYPRSTIYDSCPRYLFYALLLTSCITRWTGWLVDVFLGAAVAYAGTAAIQAFILVSNPASRPSPGVVSIPWIASKNETSTLLQNFPQLVTDADAIVLEPAALELDADAILAVVVTGYLVFLPLQCWSRMLSHNRARMILFSLWNLLMLAGSICALVYWPIMQRTPTQYMFCYPDLPPFDTTSSDGWQKSWRTSTWNESVWSIFSNDTKFQQLGDLCFNPCFNTSQILRQQTSMRSSVISDSELQDESSHHSRFWDQVVYSKGYIYSLIVLCIILNCLLLAFKLLPLRSRIRSAQPISIWTDRKLIYQGLKEDFSLAVTASKPHHAQDTEMPDRKIKKRCSILAPIRPILTTTCLTAWLRFLAGVAMLVGLVFSIIISPFTVIAFIVWIEWYIHHDGASQENPQQVGQWAYLVSIGLLVISAAILKLKYRVASRTEMELELESTRRHLENLEKIKASKS